MSDTIIGLCVMGIAIPTLLVLSTGLNRMFDYTMDKLKKPKKHKKMHPAECRRTRCTHQNVQCYCNRKGA